MSLEPRRNEWPAETNEHQGCWLNQEYFVRSCACAECGKAIAQALGVFRTLHKTTNTETGHVYSWCVGFVPGRMVMSAWSCSYGLFNDAVCRSNGVTFSE